MNVVEVSGGACFYCCFVRLQQLQLVSRTVVLARVLGKFWDPGEARSIKTTNYLITGLLLVIHCSVFDSS